MCGRFTHMYTWRQLHRLMRLTLWPPSELPARYNVAPTQAAPVVHQSGADRIGELMLWGVPGPRAAPLINARSETASKLPTFRDAFRVRRCIVPATGFYEWQRAGSAKQPWYIRPAGEEPFYFAGLWQESPGEARRFTILTTTANGTLAPIHDRMPVIIPPASIDLWLDPAADPAALSALLVPAPEVSMRAYTVGRWVNKPGHDDADCIEPVEGDKGLWG